MSEQDSTGPEETAPVTRAVPFVLRPEVLTPGQEAAVLGGAAVAAGPRRVIAVAGPGAVTCLQGVLTNDVERHGDRGFVYGAVLTTKGMIVSDLWVARTDGELLTILPAEGADAAIGLFHQYFPPRLARILERGAELVVLELLGPQGTERLQASAAKLPGPGSAGVLSIRGCDVLALQPEQPAPFATLLVVTRANADHVTSGLVEIGFTALPADATEFARIVAGWPRVGAEIGEKTLPQEVRFDDIDGVSYTKGCYTGQETVARVHFRGHANRWLGAVIWPGQPDLDDATVHQGSVAVGRVTSAAWSHAWKMWLGLAVVRREVSPGAAVRACGTDARLVRLPLPTP